MSQGRRQFTDEFKQEAVALLASSGRPLTQVAEELGIAPSMLRNWRNRGGRNTWPALRPNTPAPAMRSVPDPAAEISRLRRENDRLRMERDILKNCGHLLGTPEMRFRLIQDHRGDWPVRVMCGGVERVTVRLLRVAITAGEPAQDRQSWASGRYPAGS